MLTCIERYIVVAAAVGIRWASAARPRRTTRGRKADDAVGRDHGVLGGGAERAVVLGEEDPDAVAGLDVVHAVADLVDDPGAVLTRATISSKGIAAAVAPARNFQSVGFTPATASRTRTCPQWGVGRSRSTSSRTDESPSCGVHDCTHASAVPTPATHASRRSGQGRASSSS